MDLHPQLAAMLAKAARFPPMHQVPLDDLRKAVPRQLATQLPPTPVYGVEDCWIEGAGPPIRVRIYRPDGTRDRPVTLFFHGSGFVICSIETHDVMCRQICRGSGSVVVSVDYRLAPEHPHPAGPDDCHAALLWAARNARALGGDPERLAVCGDSAGACMAALAALRARDEGGPALRAQILVYPVTDHYSARHASYRERGEGFGLTAGDMRWFWDHYVQATDHAACDAASPLRAKDLSRLPPAYVVTAGYDVLRDEGERFAAALAAAGTPVETIRYDDMNHGFLHWVGIIDRAGEAMDALTLWMRRTL